MLVRTSHAASGSEGTVTTWAVWDASVRSTVERIGYKTEFTPRYLFSEKERSNLVVRVRVRVSDPGHLLRAGVPAFVTPSAEEK